MGFFNKRRRTEDRSLPAENQLPLSSPAYLTSPSFPPRRITPLAALTIADVWAAVRVLADAASSLPIHVYRRSGEGRERVTSGRLVDLLERPGCGTQADLVSSLMAHVLLHGNAYLAKFREQGEVTQLGLLDPDRVRPELEHGRLRYRYSPGTGPQQMLTEADLVHVRGLSVDNLVGLSAVSQASRVLGLSDELVRHALSFFNTGEFQRPAGILRVAPESSFAGMERDKEKLKADAKPHGVLVIEGDAEYQAIAEKMDDSQFVEQRRLAAQEVARVFRIPPHMLGAPTGDSLTYSTVEQESINFVRYSLTPWLRRIELAISNDRDLAFERQFVKFEVDGLLRADAATRSEVYARALDPISGWLDVDEVRALEDLPPRSQPSTPPMPVNGNGTPLVVPVEGRSRDDSVADAIRELGRQQPPVVNVNPPPGRTVRRVVRDEQGRIEAVVDEPASTENQEPETRSTNGSGDHNNVEAFSR